MALVDVSKAFCAVAVLFVFLGAPPVRAQDVCGYYGGICREFCFSGEQVITPHFFACSPLLFGSATSCCQAATVGVWGEWSACSATCGTASRVRTRTCLSSSGCSQPLTESEACYLSSCPAVSNVGPWGSWSACSASCGSAQRVRVRDCFAPGGCSEELYQLEFCPLAPCTDNVGAWSSWSACSVTCGTGQQVRRRDCLQSQCSSPLVETQTCVLQTCPTVTVGSWGTWTSCSATCGTSQRLRFRDCLQAGGCVEPLYQVENCTLSPCQPAVTQWSSWSACSVTCGTGSQQRYRSCLSSSGCVEPLYESQMCSLSTCPPVATVTQWSSWSACSVTCGTGSQLRYRSCMSSSGCVESLYESQMCSLSTCPPVTTLTQWSSWSACSVTCGTGSQLRFRSCLSSSGCVEPLYESQMCSLSTCPPATTVTQWSAWSACSVTCGTGSQQRYRSCLISSGCAEPLYEAQMCSLSTCPPVTTVTQWSSWSACSVTCGTGSQQRYRSCLSSSGCAEPLYEAQMCSLSTCPPVTTVSAWGAWSPCSVTCGSGQRQRVRSCLSSMGCTLALSEIEACTMSSCPTWSLWSPWNPCPVTCGSGTTFRLRQCVISGTENPATGCSGSAIETQACGTQVCPDYVCGLSSPLSPRLWGATAAQRCAHPWLVHFEAVSDTYLATTCSGVLIDANSVLTTAMCGRLVDVMTTGGLGMRITVGDYNTTVTSDGTQLSITPSDVITHPGYSQPSTLQMLDPMFTESEYAVVQLPVSMAMGSCMNYACLPDQYRTLDYTTCKVLGFGFSSTDANGGGVRPSTLLEADAALGSSDFCLGNFAFQPTFPGVAAFNQSFLCGAMAAQYKLCLGDESSLLTCRDVSTGQWVVTGLGRVDPSFNCSRPTQTQLYVKVDPVLTWIQDTMATNGGL